MSVADEAVYMLSLVGDNGKSLPDKFVGYGNHGELSGPSVLPEPRVSLFALFTEPAGWSCSDIEESSGICVVRYIVAIA